MLPGTTASLLLEVADRPHRNLVHNLPLKERSLEVNVSDRPTIGSCILAKSQSRSCRRWAVRLLSIFLAVLKSAKHPSCLHFWNLPSLSRLTVSTHLLVTKFFGLNFWMSTKSKTSLSNQDLISADFSLDEHAGVDLELFESCLFPCTILARGVQRHLVHVGQKHKANRCNEVGKGVTQPMCCVQSLWVIPELCEESLPE